MKHTLPIILFILLFAGMTTQTASATINNPNFTIVVIPDSQNLQWLYPDIMTTDMNWIANNTDALNIKFVLELGDIVNVGTNITQWNRANTSMQILDGIVPYLSVPGNHDYKNAGNLSDRDLTNYNTYFPITRFSGYSWFGGYTGIGNTYGFFENGNEEYIVIGVEFCPTQTTVNWMDNLLTVYSNKTAIIFTHAYMGYDGNRINTGGGSWGGACDTYHVIGTEPEELFRMILSKHQNVRIVQSGHISEAKSLSNRTDHITNFPIYQFLNDYQSWEDNQSGNMRIMTFSPSTNNLRLQTYSPWTNTYNTSLVDGSTTTSTQFFEQDINFSLFSSNQSRYYENQTVLANTNITLSRNYKTGSINNMSTSISSTVTRNPYDINTTGLKLWYKADDNWNDSSGNNHNGTLVSTQLTNFTPAKYNNGSFFNGNGTYVNSTSKFTTGNQSIYIAWIRSDNYSKQGATIIADSVGSNSRNFDFKLATSSGTYMQFGHGNGTASENIGFPNTTYNRFHNLFYGALQIDYPNYTFYINGIPRMSGIMTMPMYRTAATSYKTVGSVIGYYPSSSFEGGLDDIRVYDNVTWNDSQFMDDYLITAEHTDIQPGTTTIYTVWDGTSTPINLYTPHNNSYITMLNMNNVSTDYVLNGVTVYYYVNNSKFNVNTTIDLNVTNIFKGVINKVNIDATISYDRDTTSFELVPIQITPSSGQIDVYPAIFNTTSDCKVSLNESSNNATNTALHTITNPCWANKAISIKKNSTPWNIYQANSSGTISFNYTDGYSDVQFDMQPNHAPTFDEAPTTHVFYLGIGDIFYNNATDIDNDPLTWTTNASIGSINSTTGVFSFTPNSFQIGVYTVNISVFDGYEYANQSVPINVVNSIVSSPDVVAAINAMAYNQTSYVSAPGFNGISIILILVIAYIVRRRKDNE